MDYERWARLQEKKGEAAEYFRKKRKILSRRARYPVQVPRAETWFRDAVVWSPEERRGYSLATGQPGVFEVLFHTRQRRWIVHRWRKGPRRRYHYWFEIEPEEARAWLQRCDRYDWEAESLLSGGESFEDFLCRAGRALAALYPEGSVGRRCVEETLLARCRKGGS